MVELRRSSRGVFVTNILDMVGCFRRPIDEVVPIGDIDTKEVILGGCWFTRTPQGILVEPQNGATVKIRVQVEDEWLESRTKETIFLLRNETAKSYTLEVVGRDAA